MWSIYPISLIFAASLGGCRTGAEAASRPVPSFAESRGAQEDFRRIEADWLRLGPGARASLEGPLRTFLAQHAADDRARVARVYLALVLVEKGELAEAEPLVRAVRRGPQGSPRDFATVVDGAIRIRRGDPAAALRLLEPLRGKLVDPGERLVFGEQLVRATLASEQWGGAVDAMIEWIADAAPEHRPPVEDSTKALLGGIPDGALERILRRLDTEAGSRSESTLRAPARDFVRGAVRGHLAEVALARQDAALAKRLVERSPAGLLADQEGQKLVDLATSGTIAPRIARRTVGLVLGVATDAARERSAAAAGGMAKALGLPAGRHNEDAVRLVMRDAGESPGAVTQALAGLAGDGAGILVAGVDADSALAAQRFAAEARIPVVLLYPAPTAPPASGFAFVLGLAADAEVAVLGSALSGRGGGASVIVGPGGVDCSAAPPAAGQPRFPVAAWKRDATAGLLVLGDATCARNVAADCATARYSPTLALGLDAATAAFDLPSRADVLVATAGDYPVPAGLAKQPAKGLVPAWAGWYEALGHDAATLASAALARLGAEDVDEPQAVARYHEAARDALASVRVALVSTSAQGFAEQRQIARTVVAVPLTFQSVKP